MQLALPLVDVMENCKSVSPLTRPAGLNVTPAAGPATVICERVVKLASAGSPAFGLGMVQPVFQLDQAVSALNALAHAQRLRVFRALVVAGLAGLTPSVLADR